ncbi:polyprenyl synthetase family protein [Nonomuraea sp. PA05]|uniref:polyprenyl synthetase family protein n=1 Tax=Nonomuraea sp. PA05 TaxID=2604466 RepID=UPI0011D4145D|nr:polyprenyl synthetase family protein [Nonomuraea sp. PA05]TYB69273.1 polyprenyl synthetase family protein [Nonomuraea sp. PA05]
MDTMTSQTGQARELVEQRLAELLEEQLGRLGFLDGHDVELVREFLVEFVLSGGKRLRPAFVHWGYRAAGGERPAEVLPAACAMELVHAAALLLDDVMDEAAARRGRPSAHVALAALHRASGRRGDAGRFGESVATLLALLAWSWADAALLETGPRLGAALDVFTRLRVEAIGGQYLDLAAAAGPGEGQEQADVISLYKSGKYTVEGPLHLGHAVAGGCPRTRRLLSAYALPLGAAFQLRDDVNGVFGDPAHTGKACADLLQGKATFLLAHARRVTGSALLDGITDERGVAAARELIVRCGALEAAEQRIAALTDEAIAALDRPPGIPPEARQALTELAALSTAKSL